MRIAVGKHFLQAAAVVFPASSNVAATLRIGTVERFGGNNRTKIGSRARWSASDTRANAPALFQPNIFRPFRGQIFPPPNNNKNKSNKRKYIIYGVSRRLMNKFIKHQH